MRRFIILSLLTLIMGVPSWGCGGEDYSHNHYLFSVFRREMMNSFLFEKELNAFWETYTNDLVYLKEQVEICIREMQEGNTDQ